MAGRYRTQYSYRGAPERSFCASSRRIFLRVSRSPGSARPSLRARRRTLERGLLSAAEALNEVAPCVASSLSRSSSSGVQGEVIGRRAIAAPVVERCGLLENVRRLNTRTDGILCVTERSLI